MKKANLLSLMILAILATSCASSLEDVKQFFSSNNKEKDLIKTFDIPAEVGNFQEEPIEKIAETKNDDKSEAKKEIKKSEVKKVVETKKVTKKVTTTMNKDEATEASKDIQGHVNPLGIVLPAEYPEEYKGYDKKAKKLWEIFEPRYFPGEQSIVAVSYLGVTAGYITIETKDIKKMNGQDVFHYYARLKSSDSYKYFYWLDDVIESFSTTKDFLPVKYELVQREKKQNVDDLQLFDSKKSMTYHWYKRVKDGNTKEEKIEKMIPSLATDSFSALQFVRGLPLKKGDVYEFPVITRGKFWLLRVDVVGDDNIVVNGKNMDAIKVKAETNFPGVLKKSGDIIFWYGKDEHRRLLKFQAKVKLGSINGELIEYKAGKKVE